MDVSVKPPVNPTEPASAGRRAAAQVAAWLSEHLKISPINQRRWQNFKSNRRATYSLWIFLGLFGVTLFAELIANDRPLLVRYKGELLVPVLVDYPEEKFGGFLAIPDYKDPVIADEI